VKAAGAASPRDFMPASSAHRPKEINTATMAVTAATTTAMSTAARPLSTSSSSSSSSGIEQQQQHPWALVAALNGVLSSSSLSSSPVDDSAALTVLWRHRSLLAQASLCDLADLRGSTALHLASSAECVAALCGQAGGQGAGGCGGGADPNVLNQSGSAPLHAAVRRGNSFRGGRAAERGSKPRSQGPKRWRAAVDPSPPRSHRALRAWRQRKQGVFPRAGFAVEPRGGRHRSGPQARRPRQHAAAPVLPLWR